MADLTGKLLAYARGGAFQPHAVDALTVAGEALGIVHASIPPHIELVQDSRADLWPVQADTGQLLQVLLNLLVNASEAIGEQPGRITLSASNCTFAAGWTDVLGKEHTAGQYVRLSVADSGCGMDEKTIRLAFEPFYSTKSRGRGLGLAAVTGIVSQHGGAIQVASQPSGGSTFEVYLPRARGSLPSAGPDPPLSGGGRETILIVDDDETVLLVLKTMLERLGYRVLAARQAAQAFELLCANRGLVALAVVDVHLEQANGHELLSQFREVSPGLPAIISSGFSEELALVEACADRRTSFMQKPYDTAAVGRAVREMLDRCASEPSPTRHWAQPEVQG
jgi:CheY-like chemotaxis protein